MIATSKTGSRFNQVLLKIVSKRFCEKYQQNCIDCLKQRSNENELECKKCGCINFLRLIIKIFHL